MPDIAHSVAGGNVERPMDVDERAVEIEKDRFEFA
jgi:hypothetical protein